MSVCCSFSDYYCTCFRLGSAKVLLGLSDAITVTTSVPLIAKQQCSIKFEYNASTKEQTTVFTQKSQQLCLHNIRLQISDRTPTFTCCFRVGSSSALDGSTLALFSVRTLCEPCIQCLHTDWLLAQHGVLSPKVGNYMEVTVLSAVCVVSPNGNYTGPRYYSN